MPRKPVKTTKRAPSGERPFPWRCRHCGKQEVVLRTIEFQAEIRHDGRLHSFTIPALELPMCQACGEKVFTKKVDAQENEALRAHLKLLTPEQIRDGIKRVGLSQKDFAARLGIAEATLSRWLNETQIQSRAMDNLLRVFLCFPLVRSALRGEDQDPQLGAADVIGSIYENSGRRHLQTRHAVKHALVNPSWSDSSNRKRNACRSAQEVVLQAGTTWGRRDAR